MKRITKITTALFTLGLFMSFSIFVGAQDKKTLDEMLKPFPQASEGMVRHVIDLPKKSDESMYKVEIVPGKTMSVDCNNHRLSGTLTEKDLEGWGYNYYEFSSDGKTISTMKACNQPNKIKFVSGQTLTVRYNSKLPIVIYAPKGFDIKYRIWKAGKNQNTKEK